MDFSFTEEQLAIRQAARDFARQECLPGVIERDDKQKLPREQLLKLADLGFLGMMVTPDFVGRVFQPDSRLAGLMFETVHVGLENPTY